MAEDDHRHFNVQIFPYCQSTDMSKISAISRVVSTGLFDFGSKKIGKQWHCNQCDNDF